MTETEKIIKRVAFILCQWYGDEKLKEFIMLDGHTYHEWAAKAVVRELAHLVDEAKTETKALPEGKEELPTP